MAATAGQLQNKRLRNETRPYGYAIVAAGYIRPDEAEVWAQDLKRLVTEGGRDKFGLLVDAREQPVQPPDTNAIIQGVMHWLRAHGVRRSAVVSDNPVLLLQVKRLATEAGTGLMERYIDVRHMPDWERVATDWIADGIEPPVPEEQEFS